MGARDGRCYLARLGTVTPDDRGRAPARAAGPAPWGPKVDAVCWFVEAGGRFAAIGALGDAAAILLGEAGTVVRGRDH